MSGTATHTDGNHAAPATVVPAGTGNKGGTPKRRVPIRTCVACRTAGGKRGLLRVVRLPDGAGVLLDATGKKSGRGAYVCPTSACVELAVKGKKLERSLKCALSDDFPAVLRQAVMAEVIAELEPAATTGTAGAAPV